MGHELTGTIPLFQHYPSLRGRIPYVSFADLPTPVEKLDRMGSELGLKHLYIKRDDVTSAIYGGNKVRKLEFLLGLALQTKTREVMTFGGAGSNHATATAVHAHQVGLRSISMLMPQPNAQYVRDNLLMSRHHGAELHQYGNRLLLKLGMFWELMLHRLLVGRAPQVIPYGGASPLGTIGFVNAAFELKQQIEEGQVPEPDVIYVAMGSMGTAVGLVLGLKALGLKTRVVPVRVVPSQTTNPTKFVTLFNETNILLRAADPAFPIYELPEDEVGIVHDFFGSGYGALTKEGVEAIRWAGESEGIKLDVTYTGKTFAALIDAAQKGELKDQGVLFWLTLNSRDFSDEIAGVDYHELPRCFHRYFAEEVLPRG